MKTVRVEQFAELLGDIIILDTRSKALFKHDGFKGSHLFSLEQAQAGELPDFPKETRLYLLCEWGRISHLVGLYLEAAGYSNVYNLAGGMKAWRLLQTSLSREKLS